MDSEVVKLGKKGQLNVPREVMERLGLHGGDLLILEVNEDGAIVLRPTGVYPLEIYTEQRVAEFARADSLTTEERERLSEAGLIQGQDE